MSILALPRWRATVAAVEADAATAAVVADVVGAVEVEEAAAGLAATQRLSAAPVAGRSDNSRRSAI